MSLDGRVAIVTGGGGGMGGATAVRLAELGAHVLAVDIPSKAADAPQHERIRFFAADLRDETQVEASAAQARDAFGRIDILVNSAGVVGALEFEPFGSWENWVAVRAINLDAVWRLSRAVLEDLKVSGHGRIVNLGSVASEFPTRGGAPAYDASKHAVYGLTKNMAMNLGQFGITVNAVLPGPIDTPMTQAYPFYEQFVEMAKARTAVGRIGNEQDIAGAIAFLVSDEASFITGHGLFVDGGIHLNV